MDDYTSNVLNDSKNEWSILLINYIAPHIIDGFKSIFNESVQLCEANDEIEKYLMTYQNLLSRIPKWNQTIILAEQERIIKTCNCSYLEDLITCVHILQLKILSCVRVGSESKKVSINIPDMTTFIHQIYINIARKLYSNIYLFEIDILPLEQQRRNREFELLVQTCIMNTIRDKIPVEALLRQYIDETQEVEVTRVEKTLNNAKSLNESTLNTNNNTNNNSNSNTLGTNNNNLSNLPIETKSFDTLDSKITSPSVTRPIITSPIITSPNERGPTIKFNPEPSILEIEANPHSNDSFSMNDSNDTISIGDVSSISFEELDPTPMNIEFEEL